MKQTEFQAMVALMWALGTSLFVLMENTPRVVNLLLVLGYTLVCFLLVLGARANKNRK